MSSRRAERRAEEKETAEKLNHVSETIKKLANTYVKEQKNETYTLEEKEENKQIFINELLNNLEPYKDNLLYEDIANVDGKIVDKIFSMLLEKQEIEREDLLKIFADCNSYIVGFDDKEISQKLEENIYVKMYELIELVDMAIIIADLRKNEKHIFSIMVR